MFSLWVHAGMQKWLLRYVILLCLIKWIIKEKLILKKNLRHALNYSIFTINQCERYSRANEVVVLEFFFNKVCYLRNNRSFRIFFYWKVNFYKYLRLVPNEKNTWIRHTLWETCNLISLKNFNLQSLSVHLHFLP